MNKRRHSFCILLASLALFDCKREARSNAERHGSDNPNVTVSAAEIVRKKFEGVIIPHVVFDNLDAILAIEFIIERANELSSDNSQEWMFGFCISRPQHSVDALMEPAIPAPGSVPRTKAATITAEFSNISAMEALEKTCKMTGFKFTISEMGHFEVVDANDYSTDKPEQPDASQPATKPADKLPAGGQPPTPTPKDAPL